MISQYRTFGSPGPRDRAFVFGWGAIECRQRALGRPERAAWDRAFRTAEEKKDYLGVSWAT